MESSSISFASKYPYPSTIDPTGFVSVRLSGEANFPRWKMQMFCLIESQEMVGFIDGTIMPPPEIILPDGGSGSNEEAASAVEVNEEGLTEIQEIVGSIDNSINDGRSNVEEAPRVVEVNEEYRMWKRSDRLVKGWILGSLCEEVLDTIIPELSTAKDIWMELENSFGPKSPENEDTKEVPKTVGVNTGGGMFSVKLTRTGTNLATWSRELQSIIVSQDMSDLCQPAPSEFEVQNEVYVLWRKRDLLLKEWILGSLSDDVLHTVKNLPTSRDVLTELEKTYFQPEVRNLSQNTMPTEKGNNQSLYAYQPLYKAAIVGDWGLAKNFLEANKGAETARISLHNETLLHVAVKTRQIHFMKKLVELLPNDALMLRTVNGSTPISYGAMFGNIEAVKILVNKNPALLGIHDNEGNLPITCALDYGKKDIARYLLSVSTDDDYAGGAAVDLLVSSINLGLLDIGLDIVKRYPHAARLKASKDTIQPLLMMARRASYFRSGMRLNFLESFIYSCVPLEFERGFDRFDVENPANGSKTLERHWAHMIRVCQRLHLLLWDVVEFFVPLIKNIHRKKLGCHQAIQLVRCLCEGVKSSLDDQSPVEDVSEPVTLAAESGTFEIVREIMDIFPHAIWSYKEMGESLLRIAVQNRCEKVFNLLCQKTYEFELALYCVDESENNILHTAGQLAPLQKLNLVSGAALQMQRELQWFQEVENLVQPFYREARNSSHETPPMVFTREHKELVIEGEKWMKDTANSCTIAASLIITMVFAAAITVPGGNNGDTGLPLFSNGTAFWLFAISDAISFFTSTTSLLMFLSILTARYAEQDFLHALPKRLILGLLTLFLSITSMIIAFSSTVYLVFGEKRGWILIPLAALSCLPITSFATLQFPLLIDVISSTYGHGIFGKKNNRPLH